MQAHDVIKPIGNSVIGWLGGKTKLRATIINCMPLHKCYVEIFAGSATIFFGKPPSRIEIINDVHGELVNLMKVISGTYFDSSVRDEFIGYVRSMPAARKVYEDWKHWTASDLAKLNDAQRAFRFYYCVKKGFSSIPKGGYEASPLSSNRYNMHTDFERFAERFRVSNAQIECMDFKRLVEKYNRQRANTFFMGDPPYFVADRTSYYEYIFSEEDHNELKKCCDSINHNENTFLLTYDDVEPVIGLYKEYYLYKTDLIVYSAADERGDRSLAKREIIITNYDISKVIHDRNTSGKRRIDLFDDIDANDKRIDIAGHIGLERIN